MPKDCGKCGTTLPDDAKFCFACGKRLQPVDGSHVELGTISGQSGGVTNVPGQRWRWQAGWRW